MQHPETEKITVTSVQALLKVNDNSYKGVGFILDKTGETIKNIVKNDTLHVVLLNKKGGFNKLNPYKRRNPVFN